MPQQLGRSRWAPFLWHVDSPLLDRGTAAPGASSFYCATALPVALQDMRATVPPRRRTTAPPRHRATAPTQTSPRALAALIV